MTGKTRGTARWLEHDADIRLELRAPSLEGLFLIAAEALVRVMIEDEEPGIEPAPPERSRSIRLEGEDRESLLVAWLNEIIFLVDEGTLLPRSIRKIRIDDRSVTAEAVGTAPGEGCRLVREIKAATYHGLRIRNTDGCWSGKVLFDV